MKHYEIVVNGHLDQRWARHFEGLTMAHLPTGETLFYGPVADQAALHAILSSVRDLGLTLIRVEQKNNPS
jgi:hypothetical protein